MAVSCMRKNVQYNRYYRNSSVIEDLAIETYFYSYLFSLSLKKLSLVER